MSAVVPYAPVHPARSEFRQVRGLRLHLSVWGELAKATPEQPLVVLMHGWMDCGPSFQFMVDALRRQPGDLDLTNFSQHLVKVKIAYGF